MCRSSTDCRDCCNSRVEGANTECASPTAAPAKPRNARPRSRPSMVIKTIEGRRSSSKQPIPAAERQQQLANLARNGVPIPHADGVPGATKPGGAVSAAEPNRVSEIRNSTRRVASCRNCGNDPEAIPRAFKAGVLAAYWDTYAGNLAATSAREQAERERQAVNRWHE
jgi:hypothetical protein